MARFTIIGFTEAELGFVLAALFAALAGHHVAKARADQPHGPGLRDSVTGLEHRISTLEREADSLRKLTSRLPPFCSERGETSNSIARIVVTSATTYRLDNVAGPIDTVLGRLGSWLARSKSLECRYRIDVAPARGMAAVSFIQGSERLAKHFYLRRGK